MDLIEIKGKKYAGLGDALVRKELDRFLKQNPRANDSAVKKGVRKSLHELYGSFQLKKGNREDYLKNREFVEILKTNVSTKERLGFYEDLYKEIFSFTGYPKSILDIGCGMNPVSFVFMGLKKVDYFAIDIDKDDLNFLNKFFKRTNVTGKTKLMDVDENNLGNLPKADVCFLFKTIDVLERKKGHKFAEKLIKSLKCKFVVVSFPTKTVGGKSMNHPQRGWIERMLERLNFKFKILNFENEIFYLIKLR